MEKDTKNLSLQEKLEIIDRECPFIPFTGSSRIISTLNRMIKQVEYDVPVAYRFSHAISTKDGLRPNQMTEERWNGFFNDLKFQLKRDYPDSFKIMFPED